MSEGDVQRFDVIDYVWGPPAQRVLRRVDSDIAFGVILEIVLYGCAN